MEFDKMTMQERAERFICISCQKYKDRINGMISPTLFHCDEEQKTLAITYQTQPWQMNQMDILHGGMVATMFDQTMGTLARSAMPEGRPIVTAELSISYLRSVTPGDQVEVRCQIKSMGRTLIRVYGEMFQVGTGVMTATGTSVFAVVQNRS